MLRNFAENLNLGKHVLPLLVLALLVNIHVSSVFLKQSILHPRSFNHSSLTLVNNSHK